MTRFGYQRTSTAPQDGQGQRARLISAGIDPANLDPFTDTGLSGMKASRPGLDKLLSVVTRGDVITITELSRLGRSVANVLSLIEDLDGRGVSLVILDMGGSTVDTSTSLGRFFLGVLSCCARLERDLTSDRTKAALAARKAAGKPLGRTRTVTDQQVATARKLRGMGVPVGEVATTLGVPRSSLYRYLSEAEAAAGG